MVNKVVMLMSAHKVASEVLKLLRPLKRSYYVSIPRR